MAESKDATWRRAQNDAAQNKPVPPPSSFTSSQQRETYVAGHANATAKNGEKK